MTANLFLDRWKGLDPHEVRLVLDKRFGGPGQYDSESAGAERLHLPRARSSCRVALDFDLKDNSVKAIKSGPAFDAAEWRQVSKEMDGLLRDGPLKIGRQFSFSSYRVPGTWRGKDSFVQIMPVPADAPQSSVEAADHPFVLEFPFVASDFDLVTRYRWQREHRHLTRLLNVLLNGHTSHELARHEGLWALEVTGDTSIRPSKWVQPGYVAKLGWSVIDDLSPPLGERLEELTPEDYYDLQGLDGKGLRVPSDLDEQVRRYQQLTSEHRAQFDRAAFWLDMAYRQWPIAMSLSFAALASAIESLTEPSKRHSVFCKTCGKRVSHDKPGSAEKFRSLLERFAPSPDLEPNRSEMYRLRSRILHGSGLMTYDEGRDFGWDPPGWSERELHRDLWKLTKIALRNWLATDRL